MQQESSRHEEDRRAVGPAKQGPGQIFRREPTGRELGAVLRYRNINEHPLTLARRRNWINPRELFAGEQYSIDWDKSLPSHETKFERTGSRGTFCTVEIEDKRILADRRLAAVHRFLKPTDLSIVRAVCGWRWPPAAAIGTYAKPYAPKRVKERFQRAMKALVLAREKARLELERLRDDWEDAA